MENKSSFIFYPAEFLAIVHNFRKTQIADLIIALAQHNQYNKFSIKLSEPVHEAFLFLQKKIDENNQKYFETVEKRALGGHKGGRPKKQKENLEVFETIKKEPISKPDKEKDKEDEKDNVFIINNKNKGGENVDKSGFVGAPSIEAVADYCQSSGYLIDPIAFVNWNKERGWMNGKKYIALDWQKAVRKWYCKENHLQFDEIESVGNLCNNLLGKIREA